MKKFDLSIATLHIIAMILMLGDHLWATFLPNQEWLTILGRIAFPMFAFMVVEGFFHTHDFKKYLLRMFVCALFSEIPFDLMIGGTIFSPYHQNVIWTFIIGLIGIYLIETVKATNNKILYWISVIAVVFLGFILGTITAVDYYGAGVWTVYAFYFFRGKNSLNRIGQLLSLYFINIKMLGGQFYPINLFGYELEIYQQGFALLSLIFIWLYKGRQGYHSKPFQYFCYAFYPGHLLILGLLMKFLYN